MDKQKALNILQSIHKDKYFDWKIPHCPKYCAKEITLMNGQKVTQVMEDEVYDFLEYVKNLIENAEV